MLYLSLLIATTGTLLYHFIQKSTPTNVHLTLSIVVTYAVALCVSLVILFLQPPKEGIVAAFQKLNWTSYALALCIVGWEFGFFMMYRAGWPVSLAAIISTALASILLVPLGFLLFRENVSILNILGAALCIGGIILANIK